MVSSAFAEQSQYQADMLNLSDIRVSFVRHPISDATSDEMVSKAEESWAIATQAIETSAPLQVPVWVESTRQGCNS